MALSQFDRALLDVIASTEAPDYNVIYGGSRFSDYSDHPRRYITIKSGPNKGRKSSAAGRYQFLGSTWDAYRNKLNLPDFSPASQDRAAIALASDVFRQKTGGNLENALMSGDPNTIAKVGRTLAGTWTSLPGGIEQGQGTSRFVNAFTKALSHEARGVVGDRMASDEARAQNMIAAADSATAGQAAPQAPPQRGHVPFGRKIAHALGRLAHLERRDRDRPREDLVIRRQGRPIVAPQDDPFAIF